MQKSRIFLVVFSLTVFSGPLHAAPLPTGLGKLAAYAGTWKTEVGHFDTPYSKTGTDSAILKNDCWRSGGFYACHQYVNGESKALLVFTYDAKERVYSVYPVVADGGAVQPGKLIIHGNVWTFPWELQEKGRTVYFHVINIFTATDTIEYREEYSMDNLHWYPMAQGYDKKQP
ncbi:MAG: hypothetical protein KGL13_00455 [Gammaproteobacteria bacterium]|nr:hypothetical protein [Gammaproteobacteria bacterium]MDE2344914.1 hypothetical protein [Gammaproteobacteria bacterium]